MCNYGTVKKEDPEAIKANQVWYIDGLPYVVLQPLAKFLLAKYVRITDGEQTPYVVIRKRGGMEVKLLTHKKFREIATRTPPEVKRYITFEQIMGAKPCWKGAVRIAHVMGVITAGEDIVFGEPDWYWLGRRAAMSNGKSQTAWGIQELYDKFHEIIGILPSTDYLHFVARVLKLIPEGAAPDRDTVKRLLGIK